MAAVTEVAGGTLGSLNVAAAASVGFVGPLSAQLDALVGVGLGNAQVDLGIQFNSALTLQANLALQVGNPLAALQAALASIGLLQASLQAALSLPPVQLTLSSQISAQAALAGALSAKLGVLKGLIAAAVAVKAPAIQAVTGFATALSAGPAIALSFDGITDNTPLSSIGALVASKFSSGISYGGNSIGPAEPASGVILVTKGASVYGAMGIILTT